jgi:hypothetical protein
MGFMFFTCAPRTARALAPKPWVGPSPCSLFHRKRAPVCVVEDGHCARWACRLDGPEVSAGAHARPVSSSLCLPSRGGGHGARVRPGAGRKTCFVTKLVVAPGAGIRVGAGAGIGVGSRPRVLMSLFVVRKFPGAARVCHQGGAGLSTCARNTIREAISRDTSSSQHAGHAVRRNAHAQRSWHLQR